MHAFSAAVHPHGSAWASKEVEVQVPNNASNTANLYLFILYYPLVMVFCRDVKILERTINDSLLEVRRYCEQVLR
jgi:hypothetical protein